MKVERLGIDPGHSALHPVVGDTGAVGILREDDCVRQIYEFLIPILARRYEVVNCAPRGVRGVRDSLRERVRIANAAKVDLFISLHNNAFSNPAANGAEVFVSGAKSRARGIAGAILEGICSNGYFNRGVKNGNFYVIQRTAMPAILVESFFITNPDDCKRFNPKDIAAAIASGVGGVCEDKGGIEVESGILRINVRTFLKGSTEQSFRIRPDLVEKILPGEYECELLGQEEGHYLVRIDGREWFVFEGHADFVSR